jgi:hypothetical protein
VADCDHAGRAHGAAELRPPQRAAQQRRFVAAQRDHHRAVQASAEQCRSHPIRVAEVRVDQKGIKANLTTVFRADERLGIDVPLEMHEDYDLDNSTGGWCTVSCSAP